MQLVVSNKPIQRKVARPKRRSLAGQCVLVLLGLQIFFFSSFVAIDLPVVTGKNLRNYTQFKKCQIVDSVNFVDTQLSSVGSGADKIAPVVLPSWMAQAEPIVEQLKPVIAKLQPFLAHRHLSLPEQPLPKTAVRYSVYTPQAPVAIFLGYVMGWPVAAISAALFIILGIIGPFFYINPFAGGGGLDYYTQPGFGYLLGMFVATIVAAFVTAEKRTSLRQIGALVCGLLSLHLVGIAYLLASSLIVALVQSGRPDWLPWVFEHVRNLSWYQLPYDALFALILIGAGFPVRYLVEMLTAPDIALKSKADRLVQQRIEELLQ